ncbi:MAG: hypothetical protein AAF170_14975, partial [Bacteroidota bacterium]
MPLRFLSSALLLVFAAPVFAQSPVGDWEGNLDIPGQTLTMVLRIAESGDSLAVTLDVPQQGATGIPATGVQSTTDSLVVEYSMFGGRHAGGRVLVVDHARAPGEKIRIS